MTAEAPNQAEMSLPDIAPAHWINYQNTSSRVVLKPGAIADLPVETAALGVSRLLLVCGGNTLKGKVFSAVRDALGERVAGTFPDVIEHSHTDLVMTGAEKARALGIDGLVAVGGGSASDTAKAIAIVLAEGGRIDDHASTFIPPDKFFPKELHRPKLPVIAVPTTASAAEVTPGLGIRDKSGRKLLFWDVKLASRLIVLDPKANVDVPAAIMAATAMNGFAHCAEGLYSRLRNPISEGLALQGIRMLTAAIPQMVAEPDNIDHRAGVLAGAHISGMVISNARVGIHHAMCHCLGALGGLSHGVANSVMLPTALGYNRTVAAGQLAKMAEAMGIDTRSMSLQQAADAGIEAVRDLQRRAGVPRRLRDTGLDRAKLSEIAEHTMADRGLFFNPRRTDSAGQVLQLLEEAW